MSTCISCPQSSSYQADDKNYNDPARTGHTVTSRSCKCKDSPMYPFKDVRKLTCTLSTSPSMTSVSRPLCWGLPRRPRKLIEESTAASSTSDFWSAWMLSLQTPALWKTESALAAYQMQSCTHVRCSATLEAQRPLLSRKSGLKSLLQQ